MNCLVAELVIPVLFMPGNTAAAEGAAVLYPSRMLSRILLRAHRVFQRPAALFGLIDLIDSSWVCRGQSIARADDRVLED